MRQSRYNEIIQIDDDKYFLFNTLTCAADVVNENIINWLKTLHLDEPNENEQAFTAEFIEKMMAHGYVTHFSAADEHSSIRKKFEELRPRFLLRKKHGL